MSGIHPLTCPPAVIEALRRAGKSTLLPCIPAVIGAALVLARETTHGVGWHSDSLVFVSIARNLLAGEGFIQFAQWANPQMFWPPIYPLLLAAPGLLAWDPMDAAGPLNAAIFGLTVLVAGLWLRGRLQSGWLAWWGCLAVMLSLPLTREASWALTEPLFILLATLSLVQLDRFLDNGKHRSLAWAAAFAALAYLTRHMGIALVVASAVLLALQPGTATPLKAKRITMHALISLAPMGLWTLHIWLFRGQSLGARFNQGISYTLPEILDGVLRNLSLWIYPDSPAQHFPFAAHALTIALWLALTLATGYLMVRCWRRWAPFCTWAVFALAYVALLAIAMMVGTTWGKFQPRFLSPAFLPALMAAAFALDRLLSRYREGRLASASGNSSATGSSPQQPLARTRQRRLLWGASAAALCGWIAWSAGWQVVEISRAQAGGIRDSIGSQRLGSEVFRHLRERPHAGSVYSNDVYAAYLANETATISPLTQSLATFKRLIERLPEPAQIVWFDDWQMNDSLDYNDFDLRFLPGVEVEADLADGTVLRFIPGKTLDGANLSAAKRRYFNQIIGEAGERVAHSNFNLHLRERTLSYVKAPCTEADTAPPFFLHVLPVEAGDLPAHSRRRGFENRDFAFHKAGLRFEGKCVVQRPLPNYRIASVRTGQFVRGEGKLWQAEVSGSAFKQ